MRGLIHRVTAKRGGGRGEEPLRERYAGDETGAEEYQGSLEIMRRVPVTAESGGARPKKILVVTLAAAALLTAGAGVSYAHGEASPPPGESGAMGSMMGGNGTGSMMPMMGGGSLGSMMGGEMQPMGSFDEDRPFDLQFIDQMTMHHEGALMSSEHMISDSERPELRKLSESIQKSQSVQIQQMRAWRERWYPDAEGTSRMMDPARMDGMMGEGAMEQVMGGSMQGMMGGDATDEMFLEMMIPHHEMAVEMSEKALTEAEHPKLRDLAQTIKDEQSAEIELMKGYLDEIEKTNGS